MLLVVLLSSLQEVLMVVVVEKIKIDWHERRKEVLHYNFR